MDEDTDAFTIETGLRRVVVVLVFHVAVVRLEQLHLQAAEDAGRGHVEFLVGEVEADAIAGPERIREERVSAPFGQNSQVHLLRHSPLGERQEVFVEPWILDPALWVEPFWLWEYFRVVVDVVSSHACAGPGRNRPILIL